MLTVCTETLDPPYAKREHSQVHISAYLKQTVHLVSIVQLTPAQPALTVRCKGQAPILMSVMQEGNASMSKQPITWGGKKEEGVTVALRAAILGGGRGLSRPMPLYTRNLPW